MPRRVVITGAAGFIGSHLAETLLDRDYSVIGIDNLLTGDTANIAHLANRDFSSSSTTSPTTSTSTAGRLVLHWASPASPIDYLELPIPTLKVGALGTHKALGLAKAKGARSCSRRRPRSTAIRSSIRRRKPTGATSTRSARAASTTKPSASPRR
jgi:nucleoside-diphosphate-sugar epimerase